jgi:hypothetical protein
VGHDDLDEKHQTGVADVKGGMSVAIKLNSTAAQSSLTKVFPRVSSHWPERPEITRPLPLSSALFISERKRVSKERPAAVVGNWRRTAR